MDLGPIVENTIQRAVAIEGVGLHSGQEIHLTCFPAEADTGIIFIRTDQGDCEIPADVAHVTTGPLATTLTVGQTSVQTVEHLLAAAYALDIHNMIVEISGPEVPILDGSAAPFVSLFLNAGIQAQGGLKEPLCVTAPLAISTQNRHIQIDPAPTLEILYTIQYDHPSIGTQSFLYRHSREAFIREIAPARTFGFLKEVELLQSRGLALGGSLKNAVVIGDRQVLNEEGLRFPDEFVRHKILDLLGDMALLGAPLRGRIEARGAGHALHATLMRSIRMQRHSSIASVHPTDHPPGAPTQPNIIPDRFFPSYA
jgi:UDP-3-O-[3-hydroxymyristoyl] N-acetylglucosamine deacetylase